MLSAAQPKASTSSFDAFMGLNQFSAIFGSADSLAYAYS
jgi:hypothetical protein